MILDQKSKAAEISTILPGLDKNQLDMTLRMIESGVDEKDIPYILGTDRRHSIASWANQDPKIRHLFNQAREIVLNKVENSLLRAALGGTLTTIKTGTSKTGEPIDETTVKEVGPNVIAAEKILRLFRPNPWADLNTTSEIEETMTPKQLGDSEESRLHKLGGKFFDELRTKVVEATVVSSQE